MNLSPRAIRILDNLMILDATFVLFRRPSESTFRFIMQSHGFPAIFHDIEQLDGKSGFVVAPFLPDKSTPVLLIRPDCASLTKAQQWIDQRRQNNCFEDSEKGKPSQASEKPPAEASSPHPSAVIGKKEYLKLFERFHQQLTTHRMEKLVLSRSLSIDRPLSFSPGTAFAHATRQYPDAYVYLLHTPFSGTWLGSTPELLLSLNKNKGQTVSLAGTCYQEKGDILWDDKNLREQHLVTSYIMQQLSQFHITPQINGPYTIMAGNLAHLRTDITFKATEEAKTSRLLKSLHPTPAVSGLPKEKAYKFIPGNEGHHRRYYSGFLGELNIKEKTKIYVNLRCMQIGKKSLTLFAGSGLLSSSNPNDEWNETEQKLKTMENLIGIS